jgi:hypothetical protein
MGPMDASFPLRYQGLTEVHFGFLQGPESLVLVFAEAVHVLSGLAGNVSTPVRWSFGLVLTPS